MSGGIERKITVAVIAITTVLVIAATFIFAKKSLVAEKIVDPNAGQLGAVISGAAPSGGTGSGLGNEAPNSASSAIAVGTTKPGNEKKSADKPGQGKAITWETLYLLDYKTGKAPDAVKKLHKTKVRIPGFVVPLSDDLSALKEFLLVPNPQACIHVPPPPPNLIIYGVLDKAMPIEKVSNPSWVEGTLTIEKSESEYGAASYKMTVEKMEEYKF